MRVTWQIGVTSMNALGGAVCDDYGVCHRARGFRLEGRYRPILLKKSASNSAREKYAPEIEI